jgi:hypothetical protein
MATLTVVPAARAGVEVVAGAAACATAGDQFANSGQELAIFTNASGAPITVTIVTQATRDAQAITDRTVSVTNAMTFAIGPFPVGIYNDANGLVQMTYSTEVGLSVKVIKMVAA